MTERDKEPLVWTIKERCKMCYTCVRECPAKAIRITGGQAEVIPHRCIGCGNCLKVCSQQAKQVRSSENQVQALFTGGETAALIAPSFPAEFEEMDYRILVSMIRDLGFKYVTEVATGADLTAVEYKRLLTDYPQRNYIGSSCPALVTFVEKYHPDLVKYLAPVVSPMIAQARLLRKLHGPELKLVFIGPCVAKKGEIENPHLRGEIDGALTFGELRQLFVEQRIRPNFVTGSDFDPPHPDKGMLYPLSRGSLQAADLSEDILEGEVIAADGRDTFQEAIKEIYYLEARLLEVLCCNGCIMGAGMTTKSASFRRRAEVRKYVNKRLTEQQSYALPPNPEKLPEIDLKRNFSADDNRLPAPSRTELEEIMNRMGKFTPEDELNCGACGYDTCRAHAEAIHKDLAENEMCLPYTIERLKETVHQLDESHEQLATAQEALMQSERLASMGQLAAGIAHEVNNPLGAVLLYAHMLRDEADPASESYQDLTTIVNEADRCKGIVSGLLNFARRNKVSIDRVQVDELVDQCLKVITHPPEVTITARHHTPELFAELDRDQFIQVLTNLITNAIAAMPDGGQVIVETELKGQQVQFCVSDTGVGIPPDNIKKIFDPFFTTKAPGQGTGLGLAVIYGIIKMHRGKVEVDSNTDPEAGPLGTTIRVRIPQEHGH